MKGGVGGPQGGVGAAVRHFDKGGYGALPQPRPLVGAARFPRRTFEAAVATPLPFDHTRQAVESGTPPNRCASSPRECLVSVLDECYQSWQPLDTFARVCGLYSVGYTLRVCFE